MAKCFPGFVSIKALSKISREYARSAFQLNNRRSRKGNLKTNRQVNNRQVNNPSRFPGQEEESYQQKKKLATHWDPSVKGGEGGKGKGGKKRGKG